MDDEFKVGNLYFVKPTFMRHRLFKVGLFEESRPREKLSFLEYKLGWIDPNEIFMVLAKNFWNTADFQEQRIKILLIDKAIVGTMWITTNTYKFQKFTTDLG